jgi:hypothetical protein
MRYSRLVQGPCISVVLTALPALLALEACGASDLGTTSVLGDPATFQEMTVVRQGGYTPTQPPGAPCEIQGPQTTTVVASPASLSWDYCIVSPDLLQATKSTGSRALTVAELANIERTLQRVTVSQQKNCGADASVETLDLKTSAGLAFYADDFYSGCPWVVHAGRTFVTGMNDLDQALLALGP